MATVGKAIVDRLIANGGRYDPEEAPDNPFAERIVEYIDQGGGVAYGVTFEGDHNPYRYEQETEFVKNPKLIWQRIGGLTP